MASPITNFRVTPPLTAPGSPLRVSWSHPSQRGFKIAVYRGSSRGQPPEYGTIRPDARDLAGGAHTVWNRNTRSVTFRDRLPTSGRVCNGTYEVRMYVVDDTDGLRSNEPSLSERAAISGVPCSSAVPRYTQPAPRLSSPTRNQVFQGTNVYVAWTIPSPGSQSRIKISIYRAVDILDNGEPRPGVTPRWGTSTFAQLSASSRSHWITYGERNITFRYSLSTVAATTNGAIPVGLWVLRMRYENSVGDQSLAAWVPFEVRGTTPAPPPDFPEPGEPEAGEGRGVHWLTARRDARADQALELDWNAVFASGQEQSAFRIRRNLSAGPNTGDSYYSTGGWTDTNTDAANLIASAATALTVPGLATGRVPASSWGDPGWGEHNFYVTGTDVGGVVCAESPALLVNPYLPISISGLTFDTTGTSPSLSFNVTAAGTNNTARDVRIRAWPQGIITSGQPRPEPSFGTVTYLGQPLDEEDVGAYWAPISPALALGANGAVTFAMTESESFSDTLHAGTWVVDVQVRDAFGLVSNTLSGQITWNPAPTKEWTLHAYRVEAFVNPREGTLRVPGRPPHYGITLSNTTTGLAPGIAIGLFAVLTGTEADNGNAVTIQRREFARSDGAQRDVTPRDLPIELDDQVSDLRNPNFWNTNLVRPAARGREVWFFDRLPVPGVEYEYRSINYNRETGGRNVSPWVP